MSWIFGDVSRVFRMCDFIFREVSWVCKRLSFGFRGAILIFGECDWARKVCFLIVLLIMNELCFLGLFSFLLFLFFFFSSSFSLLLFLFFFFLNEKEAKNQEKEIYHAKAGAAPFLFGLARPEE